MIKNKKILMLLLCLILLFGFNMNVKAAKMSTGSNVYFNSKGVKTSGPSGECSYAGHDTCLTTWKYFSNTDDSSNWLYCSQLTLGLSDSKVYVKNKKFKATDKKPLLAGLCIDAVKKKYKTKDERYLYGTLLINKIFGYTSSKNFVSDSKNKELMNIYNTALDQYNKNKSDKCYSGVEKTFSVSGIDNVVMNVKSSDNTANKEFISGPITINGFKTKHCGSTMTWKVTTSVSGGTASICTDAAGKSCTNSSKNITSNKFYIKVVAPKTAALGSVSVDILGKGNVKHGSVDEYYDEKETVKNLGTNNKYQIVYRSASVSFPYKFGTHGNLTVPGTSLSIYKVDDEGNELPGAQIEVYSATYSNGKYTKVANIPVVAGSNGTSWIYNTDSSDKKLNAGYYCVNEIKSPVGYVLKDSLHCVEYNPGADSKTCYDGENNVVDNNYCGANWTCENGVEEPSVDSSTGKKICPKEDGTEQATCGDAGELVSDDSSFNGMCRKEIEFTTHEDSDPTCEGEGASLSSDETKCYVHSAPKVCNTSDGYEYDQARGLCVKRVVQDAVCVGGEGSKDSKWCNTTDQYVSVSQKAGSLAITKHNNKTKVSISKKDATGEAEVPGAVLKICDTKPDANGDCTPITLTQKGLSCPIVSKADNTDDDGDSSTSGSSSTDSSSTSADEEDYVVPDCTYDEATDTRVVSVRWTSGDEARTWSGLETNKKYYIVEDTPPLGYVSVTTSTEFTILENGNVKIGEKELLYDKDVAVINNQLSKVTISKSDIATSKEVPGATLSICAASIDKDGKWEIIKDLNGDCALVVLADGTAASWTSDTKPHDIVGLPVGDYFLVENIAPKGYSTAEAIPFSLKKDGTLTDKDGKSLKDSKITMYDKPIKDVKTGSFGIHVIFAVLLFASICGAGSYFFLKKQTDVVG